MHTESNVLVVIPARWASSRFPGKPLAKIAGIPMIQRVVAQADKAKCVSEVIVATDDSRILDFVNGAGAKAIMTSVFATFVFSIEITKTIFVMVNTNA